MNMKVLGLLALFSPLLVTGSYFAERQASTSGVAISSRNVKIQTSDTTPLATTWVQAKAPGRTRASDCNPYCGAPGS